MLYSLSEEFRMIRVLIFFFKIKAEVEQKLIFTWLLFRFMTLFPHILPVHSSLHNDPFTITVIHGWTTFYNILKRSVRYLEILNVSYCVHTNLHTIDFKSVCKTEHLRNLWFRTSEPSIFNIGNPDSLRNYTKINHSLYLWEEEKRIGLLHNIFQNLVSEFARPICLDVHLLQLEKDYWKDNYAIEITAQNDRCFCMLLKIHPIENI
jgi:hypothetical protein